MSRAEKNSETSESKLPNSRKRPTRRLAEINLTEDGKYQNPLSPHERVSGGTSSVDDGGEDDLV